MATKRDLTATEERLNAKISGLETNLATTEEWLNTKIGALDNKIVIKLGAIIAMMFGLLFAALKRV